MMAHVTGFVEGSFPFLNLGASITNKKLTMLDYEPLLIKITKKK